MKKKPWTVLPASYSACSKGQAARAHGPAMRPSTRLGWLPKDTGDDASIALLHRRCHRPPHRPRRWELVVLVLHQEIQESPWACFDMGQKGVTEPQSCKGPSPGTTRPRTNPPSGSPTANPPTARPVGAEVLLCRPRGGWLVAMHVFEEMTKRKEQRKDER